MQDTNKFDEGEEEKQPIVSFEDEHEAFAARYTYHGDMHFLKFVVYQH